MSELAVREAEEGADLINRLPVELLVLIINYIPHEYLYTLPRWCIERRFLLKDRVCWYAVKD